MDAENIRVAVRVRPFTEEELLEDCECIVNTKGKEIKVVNPENGKEKTFNFDFTYCSTTDEQESCASQEKMVADLSDFALSSAFDGYNACVFSYGASGSGKSLVMYGTQSTKGLIQTVCEGLFTKAVSYEDDTSFRAEVSFLEIHKEFVKDLLGRRRNWHDSLRVREHPELGVYVDKLTKHIVTDCGEVYGLIEKGKKNRSVCSRSSDSMDFSNSHTIFTIRFTQARLENGMPCEIISTIYLVDLAGNRSLHIECNGHTDADTKPTSNQGDKSLITLDQVISALASRGANIRSKIFSPYRESDCFDLFIGKNEFDHNSSNTVSKLVKALTWILKDCLGGNCKTIMLAAVSPAHNCYHETLSTLRYGNQVKKISNWPRVNEDPSVQIIRELKLEIIELKMKMQRFLPGSIDRHSARSGFCVRERESPAWSIFYGPQSEYDDPTYRNQTARPVDDRAWKKLLEKRAEHKAGGNVGSDGLEKTEKKLQENQELMKRLTGIWEDKWSKTQKIIEERALAVTELGSALKFETEEPHFVSLGGGRLSIGVTLCPINKGKTVIGASSDSSKPDIVLRGRGIDSEHCVVEYNGDVVVLHPKAPLCSVDGIPIAEPTKLPQGCMLCLGKSNYFRFNHPKEARRIKEANPGNRFSIVPDGYYPDVELAVEQWKKDRQERDRLKKENERLQSVERQYKDAVERIEFEKSQLVEERQHLQELEKQQKEAAETFEKEIAAQIQELEQQRKELKLFEDEKEKLLRMQQQVNEGMKKKEEERATAERTRHEQQEYLKAKRALLELDGEDGADVELMQESLAIEEERQKLALLELDDLEDEVLSIEQQKRDHSLLEEEQRKLEEVKQRQGEVILQLEEELNAQIRMLKEEREAQNLKLQTERDRILILDKQHEEALRQIELERQRLEEEKEAEKKRLQEEKDRLHELEAERMQALERAAKEQEAEKEVIETEKKRLLDLESKHADAVRELEESMISKQEKMERERQIEFEFFETEQLLLEELEQKQREAAEQLEKEREAMREQLEKEREEERFKHQEEQERMKEQEKQQREALRQVEEERKRLQVELVTHQEQVHKEKSRRMVLEQEFRKIRSAGPGEGLTPLTALVSQDPSQLGKGRTPQERKRQLEEERRRLMELKREADSLLVKAKGEADTNQGSGNSIKVSDEVLAALESERKKRQELEKLLSEEKERWQQAEIERQKVEQLEKALGMERLRRQETEKALFEKQKKEELDRLAAEEKARKELLTEKAISERLPDKVKMSRHSYSSTDSGGDLNLAQHIVSAGHVLENCPSVKVTNTCCKGYLSKMGGKFKHTWKKRWFVFDRQKRALCYYTDEHKREPKGIIYFQAIQEVYVDSTFSNKGHSPKTAFCVKTPQKTYYLAAPSGLALSIWIDVILTGREGANFTY